MSLLDTDKSSSTRSQPSLNASDGMDIGAVKHHATDGIAYRSEEGIHAPRVVQKDDQIIVFDGDFNKALFGRDGSGNYVVRIAKDGFDVLLATSDQVEFDSGNNVFKIVETNTVSIASSSHSAGSADNIDATVNFTGTYSSKPVVIGVTTNNTSSGTGDIWGGEALVPKTYSVGSGSGVAVSIAEIRKTIVSTTTAIFRLTFLNGQATSQTNAPYTIRYYVLRETAV